MRGSVKFLALLALILGLKTGVAYAERKDTTDVCYYNVQAWDNGQTADGRDVKTLTFSVDGNDHARAFLDAGTVYEEPGFFADSGANTCLPNPSNPFVSWFWDGKEINLGSIFFSGLFGGKEAKEVYIGTPSGGTVSQPAFFYDYNFGGFGPAGDMPCPGPLMCRAQNGITTINPTAFASINDAGLAMVNNQTVWCMGMNYSGVAARLAAASAQCPWSVSAPEVYDHGGTFAGYQNADNPNATANVIPSYRGRVSGQLQVNDLVGYEPGVIGNKRIPLRLLGLNTRDPLGVGWWVQCENTKPGIAPCLPPGGLSTEPFLNTRTEFVLSFVLDAKDDPPYCSVNPLSFEAGDSDEIQVRVTYPDSTSKDISSNMNVLIVDVATGAVVYSGSKPINLPSDGSTYDFLTDTINFSTPGQYTYTATIDVLPPSVFSCTGTINIHAKPYIKAFGSDIIAGISATCTNWGGPTPKESGVYGFYSGNKGASAQLGIISLGPIMEFESHSLNSPGDSLKFANTVVTKGQFATPHACPVDYFADYDPSLTNVGQNVANWPTGVREHVGTGHLPNSAANGQKNSATKTVVYRDGDVYIDFNIRYMNSGSWNSIGNMQSITLIVRGDVYIRDNVSNIDANIIVQPRVDGTGGIIYTCTDSNGALKNANDLYDECNNQLTINGAVVAKTIKWQRTFGSRKDATTGEQPSDALGSCTINTGIQSSGVCAGEVVNFTPEVYMGGGVSNGREKFQTDAISILPPIL